MPADYANMSDELLLVAAARQIAEIRRCDDVIRQDKDYQIAKHSNAVENGVEWTDASQELIAEMGEATDWWMKVNHQEVESLIKELESRVGGSISEGISRVDALQIETVMRHRMLAGAYPLLSLATGIEELAKRLQT